MILAVSLYYNMGLICHAAKVSLDRVDDFLKNVSLTTNVFTPRMLMPSLIRLSYSTSTLRTRTRPRH